MSMTITDPTDRILEEVSRSSLFALRVRDDVGRANVANGDIVVVKRMTTMDRNGERYIIAKPGLPTPTLLRRLFRLDDGLVEVRDELGTAECVVPEANLDIQGRVLNVIRHV